MLLATDPLPKSSFPPFLETLRLCIPLSEFTKNTAMNTDFSAPFHNCFYIHLPSDALTCT